MIGFANVECILYDVHSLKEKRSIIKQVLHSIRNRYNVSITELDYHDMWQRTAFGIAVVSVSKVNAEKMLQQVIQIIENRTDLEVTIVEFEWL
ncbi:DUF503 domain-containing protein [Bacillaceae bacterium W0354]